MFLRLAAQRVWSLFIFFSCSKVTKRKKAPTYLSFYFYSAFNLFYIYQFVSGEFQLTFTSNNTLFLFPLFLFSYTKAHNKSLFLCLLFTLLRISNKVRTHCYRLVLFSVSSQPQLFSTSTQSFFLPTFDF